MTDLYAKLAEVLTPLQDQQSRLIEKLRASGGVVADWKTGSGKTLGAIAAKDALGVPADVVVPAPLQENFRKELVKHTGEVPDDVRVRSYERASRSGDLDTRGLVVFDEAHRGRNPGTGPARLMREARNAPYRLPLSGTVAYNHPWDVAPLVNTAAGRDVLPEDPRQFAGKFIGTKRPDISLYDTLKGKLLGHSLDAPGTPTLVNRDEFVKATRGYVDVHRGASDHFPERQERVRHVPMSDEQHRLYRFHEGSMPWYLRLKVQSGLPLSKQESSELNAFEGALRQVSNTPRAYTPTMTDEEELKASPKLRAIVDDLKAARGENPNHRAVIYSNYLESGLNPIARALQAQGIPHQLFTGAVTNPNRARMVNDYNEGRNPVMLLSGAGAEGLDLKGTRDIYVTEPHWNDSRTKQVEGRGIRYMSHEHLPEADRNVRVNKYYSDLPVGMLDRVGRMLGAKPKQSIEQYLQAMSDEKARLGGEVEDALQEASDYGPLRPGDQGYVGRRA